MIFELQTHKLDDDMGNLRVPNCEDIATKQIVVEKNEFSNIPTYHGPFHQPTSLHKKLEHMIFREYLQKFGYRSKDVQEKILCIHKKTPPLTKTGPSLPHRPPVMLGPFHCRWRNKSRRYPYPGEIKSVNFSVLQPTSYRWFRSPFFIGLSRFISSSPFLFLGLSPCLR